MLLVQGIGEIEVLPSVTAVLLHHNVKDIWTVSNVVNAVKSIKCGAACSYSVLVRHSALDTWTDCKVVSTA